MAKTTLNKEFVKYIRKCVNKVYPNQKNGDCYGINSSVAHILYNLGYNYDLIQGKVFLTKEIYDPVLEENQNASYEFGYRNKKGTGITQYPDHIWIKVRLNGARRIYDFAKNVFGNAKILYYCNAVDTLSGTKNRRLYSLLNKNLKKEWYAKYNKEGKYYHLISDDKNNKKNRGHRHFYLEINLSKEEALKQLAKYKRNKCWRDKDLLIKQTKRLLHKNRIWGG
jgi:hypothetical protein